MKTEKGAIGKFGAKRAVSRLEFQTGFASGVGFPDFGHDSVKKQDTAGHGKREDLGQKSDGRNRKRAGMVTH